MLALANSFYYPGYSGSSSFYNPGSGPGSYPGGSYPGGSFSYGSGGSYPGGSYPGGSFSYGSGGSYPGGSYSGGSYSGGSYPGGSYPGGSFSYGSGGSYYSSGSGSYNSYYGSDSPSNSYASEKVCHYFSGSKCVPKYDVCKLTRKTFEQCLMDTACTWNSATQQCASKKDSCSELSSDVCMSTPDCEIVQESGCKSNNCIYTCMKETVECMNLDDCPRAYNCSSYDRTGSMDCKAGLGAGLLAYNNLEVCFDKCLKSQGMETSVPATSTFECMTASCAVTTDNCLQDPSCKRGASAVAHYINTLGSCNNTCMQAIATYLDLTFMQIQALNGYKSCYNKTCELPVFQCKNEAAICGSNKECSAALRLSGLMNGNGTCDGGCLTRAFQATSEDSLGRIYLVNLLNCVSYPLSEQLCKFNTSDTCTATTELKRANNVRCFWGGLCTPRADACSSFASSSSQCIANGCAYLGAGDCRNQSSVCAGLTSETSCSLLGETCQWKGSCVMDSRCKTRCSLLEQQCLHSDSCFKAWKCFQSTGRTEKDASTCASGYIRPGSDAAALFKQYTRCATQCESSAQCATRCERAMATCEASEACNGIFQCLRGEEGNCDTACAARCLSMPAPEADRALLYALVSCLGNCGAGNTCGSQLTEASCQNVHDCEWNKRCAKTKSKSCSNLKDSRSCSALSKYCFWDDHSYQCLPSSQGCYANITTETQAFAVSHTRNTCDSTCTTEGICVPDDSCNRLCDDKRKACFVREPCASAFICLNLKTQSTEACLSLIPLGDQVTLELIKSIGQCLGGCKVNNCPQCANTIAKCSATAGCSAVTNCMLTYYGHDACGSSCLTQCSNMADSEEAVAMAMNVAACVTRCQDNHVQQHATCKGVTSLLRSSRILPALAPFICNQTDLLTSASSDAQVPKCAWTESTNTCSMPALDASVKQAICDSNPVNCQDCCRQASVACLAKVPRPSTCPMEYKECASQCLKRPDPLSENKVDVAVSVGFVVSDTKENILSKFQDLDAIQAAVYSSMPALQSNGISSTDVIILSFSVQDSRRRSGVSVSIDFNVRASQDLQNTVISSSVSASQNFDQSLATAFNAAVQTGSVSLNSVSSASPASTSGDSGTQQTSSSSSSSSASSTKYLISTPIGTLPAGAYLTTAQKTALVNTIHDVLSIPYDTDITINMNGQALTATRVWATLPTSAQLAAEGGFIISFDYTKADGTTATLTAQTEASTAQAIVNDSGSASTSDSSSDSSVAVGVGVGVGVGCAVLIAVGVVIMRNKHRVIPHSPLKSVTAQPVTTTKNPLYSNDTPTPVYAQASPTPTPVYEQASPAPLYEHASVEPQYDTMYSNKPDGYEATNYDNGYITTDPGSSE